MQAIRRKYLALVGGVVTTVGLCSMVPTAQATLLAYEGFDYPTVPDKSYLGLPQFGGYNYNGGTGWSSGQGWFATNNDAWWGMSYATTGMTFPGLTTVGGAVSDNYHSSDGGATYDVINSGGESARIMGQTYNTGTVYISTLFSQNSDATGNGGRWDRLITDNWDFFLQFGVKRLSASSTDMSYFIGNQVSSPVTPTGPMLVVAKVNLDTNQASLYAVTDYGTASEATTYTGVTASFTRNGALATLSTGYGYGARGTSDEIRVATTFEEAIGKTPNVLPGSTWNVDGFGDWNVAGNWNNSTVPNGVDAIANLDDKISSNQTVYTNANVTLGQLHLNNANSYLVQGAGNLTFSSATTAVLSVASGSHYVTPAEVEFASNTNLNLTGNLTLSGSINGVVVDAGQSVSVNNGGNLAIVGKLHLNGTGTQMTLALKSAGTTGAILSLDNVNAIDGTGAVDLTNNNAIIHSATSASVISTLIGTSNSGKLQSSLASTIANPTVYALGVLNGADYKAGNKALLGAYAVLDTDAVVRLTYAGDVNLDGKITGLDFAQLDAAYLSGLYAAGGATWINGDSNHDGLIDATDFALMDAAFLAYFNFGSPVALARAQADAARFGEAFTSVFDAALASVPEPASLSLLMLGAGCLLGRRRR